MAVQIYIRYERLDGCSLDMREGNTYSTSVQKKNL